MQNSQGHNLDRELLFHYTKFDTALYHILPSQQLLLNPIAFMNDIYETDVRLSEILSPGSGDGIFWYFKENKIKILCLVKDEEVRGFDNQMMWSFYGEKYQGVCLIFDKKKMIEYFKNQFGEFGKNDNVEYELKKIESLSNLEELNTGFLGQNFYYRNLNYDKSSIKIWELMKEKNLVYDIFFRKNKQWIAESEYRLLAFDNNPPNHITFKTEDLFLDYKDALVGVVIGPKFNKKENNFKYECMLTFANSKGINIYDSIYDGYKIIPQRINVLDSQKEMDYKTAFLTEDINY